MNNTTKRLSIFLFLLINMATTAYAQQASDRQIDITVRIDGEEIRFVPETRSPPTTLPPTTLPPATMPTEQQAAAESTIEVPATLFSSSDVIALHTFTRSRETAQPAATTTLRGYAAAMLFDSPGVVQISSSDSSARVRVVADTRRPIFVAANGDDQNDASSPERAVRTLVRAQQLIGSRSHVKMRRGDRFEIDRELTIAATDVVLSAFGDVNLAQPTIIWAGVTSFPCMIQVMPSADRVVIDSIAFDTKNPASNFDHGGMPDAIRLSGGSRITVRRCEFKTVGAAVNGNGNPAGVLIDECIALDATGLRGYFAWVQGRDWIITRNRVANSTREAVIRVGGGSRIHIQDNDLTNLDRRQLQTNPDPKDFAKNVLTIQKGDRVVVVSNRINGNATFGPLGGADGVLDIAARWNQALCEGNTINGQVTIHHGAADVQVVSNVIRRDEDLAINIEGASVLYSRTTARTLISGNTVHNAGTRGAMLRAASGAADITMTNNTYLAPKLQTGAWTTAFVYVEATDLSSFAQVSGNIWPRSAVTLPFARGGLFYIWPSWADQRGYLTLDAWNAMPQVGMDRAE